MFLIRNRALSLAITSFGNKFCLKMRSRLIKALNNRFCVKFMQLEIGLFKRSLSMSQNKTLLAFNLSPMQVLQTFAADLFKVLALSSGQVFN